MIQFKPLVKDNVTKVMVGPVEIGRIVPGKPGETVLTLTGKASLTAADLLRVLRQMGVSDKDAPDKIETAVAAQQQVAAQVKALRLPQSTSKAKPKATRTRKA